MQGVTLNPGCHHGQKSRGVTPRLINAETKKQSHARRLSVGLLLLLLLLLHRVAL